MNIGTLSVQKPIENAIKNIREWLNTLGVNGLSVDTRYDAKQNIAVLRFNYKGQWYEFKSSKQKNCRLNMHAIARVMEFKVRSHLMQIEEFQKSMKSYVAIEASADAMSKGFSQQNNDEVKGPLADLEDYALIGANQFMSNDELKKCYRLACKAWHPDMADEVSKEIFEEKFAEINDAWQRISLERGI